MPKIVGDEQQPHPLFAFQLCQKVQDLRLNGHVQRRCRFIRDQNVRLVGQRHRDHHPLRCPPDKLVRIGAQSAFRVANTDLVHQFDDSHTRRRPGKALMQLKALADLPFPAYAAGSAMSSAPER